MFGANAMWGLMSPIAKLVLSDGLILPLVLVDFRVAGAAALFWLLSMFTPREHVPAMDLLRLFGAGMLGILLNQGCFIIGVSYTSPGDASLVSTTMPMWVMLLAWIILREPITAKKIGGIVVGAIGAVALTVSGGAAVSGGDNPVLGDLIVLAAQLCYALYLTLYRNFIMKYSLVTLMKWMFLSAAVVSIPVSMSQLTATNWMSMTWQHWAGIGYVALFGTFLAYLLTMFSQKHLRPTVVGMYNYVQPVVATAVGIYIGIESLTVLKCVAVILIFAGVWLVTISKARGGEMVSDNKNLNRAKIR